MKSRDLVDQILRADPDGDRHVEVLEHDGSWAWVAEASKLQLSDADSGVTEVVVIHVKNDGVR